MKEMEKEEKEWYDNQRIITNIAISFIVLMLLLSE